MKKTFIITMLGAPLPWIQSYVDSVQHLEKDGWNWKIFTPNMLESKGNVEIVPMDTDQFNDLVDKKLGVRPNMGLTGQGRPSVHVTDFYVFSGLIFDDYLKDSEWWGITNLDVVYGNLGQFFPDSMLERLDVFTDDVNTINGVFSLFRNTKEINELCLQIPNWKEKLTQDPCPACMGEGGKHQLAGTDEYDMTEVMKTAKVRYGYPQYYPLLSHDRLEQHVPDIKLSLEEDGSLWELFADTASPDWIHARPFIGREIPYFHFGNTKRWPL